MVSYRFFYNKNIRLSLKPHGNVRTSLPQKPDRHINVKVDFGEGEGKVSLDKIVERA